MRIAASRDKEATKARLIKAVGDLIAREGFGAVGVNAVAREAGADKVMIYRYFGGLAGLLESFAEESDFWWSVDAMLADPLPAGENALAACLGILFARHSAFLRDHPLALEVIAWEISERNALTEALEGVRERRSVELVRRLMARFGLSEAEAGSQLAASFALMGGAANYLAARARRTRTFNGIDLQSDEGWALLVEAARRMAEGLAHGRN